MKGQKYITIITCLILIISQACQQTSDKVIIPSVMLSKGDPGLKRTSDGFVKLNDTLFSGTIMEYYPNHILKEKMDFFNGRQYGEYIGFYPNGDTVFLRLYENGEKQGVHRGWYPNGQQKFEYNFVKGINEGTHMDWYDDGSIYKISNYVNGQAFGEQKVWRIDGKLRSNYIIKEDGRKYGLVGLKRCANLDTEKETFNRIKASQQ